ncbi:MAG: CPBP family intramembrane metalloprotease [Acidobacteriota bacterium]|nr:CPBP family intramembrane metalloprotease [Acidobacteriota bacterium]
MQTAIRVAMFVVFYVASAQLAGWILGGLDNPLLVGTGIMMLTGFTANALCLRIFEGRGLADCGLWINSSAGRNLLLGLAGGAGTAVVVLVPPVLTGMAHFDRRGGDPISASSVVFLVFMLAAGSIGEELIFRGYGLQTMIAAIGPWATILPLGVLFGALHYGNPGAGILSSAITAGFGILFGYAYLRSRDLWLPIGLHFGWNFTLPLFGVNMSGLKIRVTGWELSWSAGRLWSGGEYGPEASVLTVGALALLLLYIRRIPVRRQISPLIDPPEGAVCETSQPLPS